MFPRSSLHHLQVIEEGLDVFRKLSRYFLVILKKLKGLRCVSEVIETFPGDFNFPSDVFAIEDAIASLDEGVTWLVVNAASILIIAN